MEVVEMLDNLRKGPQGPGASGDVACYPQGERACWLLSVEVPGAWGSGL